jgi:cytosine/adenosine deaminase-related metal-dependent hydrolase
LLDRHGLLGADTVAVHATHVTADDISRLGAARTGICLCPTTERDLADGVGPSPALSAAGASLNLGSDSHAVIDLFEEARAIELDTRLITGQRGHHPPAALLATATVGGAQALGWQDTGQLTPGYLADFTTIRLDSVVIGGVPVVSGGRHLRVDDVGAALSKAVQEAWRE